MLVKPTMESLLKKVDGRYTLAMLAAKRARQLVNGALPLSTSDTPNYVTLACEEIVKGKVVCVKGIKDIFIPLRPEVAAERLASKAALENARLQEALDETFSRSRLDLSDIEGDELLDDIAEEGLADTLEEDAASVAEADQEDGLPEDLAEDLPENVEIDVLIDPIIPEEDGALGAEENDLDFIKDYTPDEEEK